MSARHNGRFWEREVAMPDGTSGATLIAAERRRQIEREDWTTDHDDGWLSGELALAAACYAVPPGSRESRGVEELWPWHTDEWKPSPDDRVKELAKAGALIAAEIDRLQRAEAGARAGGGL